MAGPQHLPGGAQAAMTRQGHSCLALPSVDISVGSRFHAFDLARELHARSMLHRIYTGYPQFSAKRFLLPPERMHSVWTHEPLNRLMSGLYHRGLLPTGPDFTLSDRFDRIVAGRLEPGANLFVGWSSQCLHSLCRAKELGMATVVERGSTHIEWQRDILREEAELTGMPVEVPDPRTVERELAEYQVADCIAVATEFVARTFVERGIPRERLIVNPYGVDLRLFQPTEPSTTGRGLRVIHVGRVSVQKGVHYLIEAVGRLPQATLTVVGAPDPDMSKLLSASHVNFIGPVPGRDLPRYYAQADVFCLLSLQEGLALVLAQAMAMGLPIIATPNTGAADLITDGVEGFLVPVRNPDVVVQRLRWLAENPEMRREMGRRARAKVESGFSWADYGVRAAAAYCRLIGNFEGACTVSL
jgi:glycosyltransferase involved in cell wall biosynthesis